MNKETKMNHKPFYPRFLSSSWLNSLARRINAYFMNFAADDASPELRRRVAMLEGFSLIGIFNLIFFGLLALLQNSLWVATFDLLTAAALYLNLLDGRKRKKYDFNICVGISIIAFQYVYLYLTGGVNKSAFVWYLTFPLIASFLLKSKTGAMATILMTLPILLNLSVGFSSPYFMTYSVDFQLRFLFSFIVIGALSFIFKNTQEQNRKDLRLMNENLEKMVQERTRDLRDVNQNLVAEIAQKNIAEEALRENEAKYRLHFEHVSDVIYTMNTSFIVTSVSPSVEKVLGYAPEELIGKPFQQLGVLPPEYFGKALRETRRIFEGERILASEYEFIAKNGKRIIGEVSGAPILHEQKTMGAISVARDITERKRAEQILKKSESKYRGILENITEGYFEADLSGNLTFFNDSLCEISGFPREQLMGMSNRAYMNAEDAKRVFQAFNKVYETGEPIKGLAFELLEKKDMSRRYLETSVSLITDESGKPTGFRGVLKDVTDRIQAEAALKDSEQKLRNIVEHSNELFYLHGIDHRLIYVSPQCMDYFGYTQEEMKVKWMDLMTDNPVNEAGYALTQKAIQTGRRQDPYLLEGRKKDGSTLWLQIDESPVTDEKGSVLFMAGAARDITKQRLAEEEKERLEFQLRQSQKMEAIGTLSGGIAHDFNNMLAIILGNAELAIEDIPGWNPGHGKLKEIRSTCLRAKDVVQQLLAFSRKTQVSKQPIQIDSVVKDTLRLLRASIPANIEIRTHIDEGIRTILGDATQINQVLINLCTNARDSMPEGGLLKVTVTNTAPENGEKQRFGEGHVKLTVTDTGSGISPKDLNRIFDPYFTTKAFGKGTGMGLAVVHGIVKAHGGMIQVKSEPGQGSTFEVFFPATEQAPALKIQDDASIPEGTERILFVDDEDLIADLNHSILERLGYQVTSTTRSTEALEIFRNKPNQFDLVITDMSMPKMTGDQLIKELLKIRPDIPILLCTGYSERITEEKAQELGIRAYAQKPLELKKLAKTVRSVLDEPKK